MQSILDHYIQEPQQGGLVEPDFPPLQCNGVALAPRSSGARRPEARAHGPISLMLAYFSACGIAIDHQWKCHFPGMRVLDLFRDPWQALLLFLSDCYIEYELANQRRPRASLGPSPSVDWQATFNAMKALPGPKQSMLRSVQCGAIITPQELSKAGLVDGPRCRECGAEEADLEHMLWICPAYQRHRHHAQALMGNMEWGGLPKPLALHGLAPMSTVPHEGPEWAGSPGYIDFNLTSMVDGAVTPEQWTERLLSEVLTGPFVHSDPTVLKVTSSPPELPNMYTDGSFVMGRTQHARGGAGLHVPEATRQAVPLEGSDFLEFAHEGPSQGSFHARVAGPPLSYTRAEVVASGVALTWPGPLHIATDSMGLVHGFKRIGWHVTKKGGPNASATKFMQAP